jgi:dTDP-4-dehydrorhamnose reductase
MHGGNGRHAYADVEAVRILPQGCLGPRNLLEQVWERYRIPVAVTEVHLGCSREEQLRWLRDVWTAACEARTAGADIRAVTAWSAFGAYDWDSLVTRDSGRYETGLFDVRSDPPRPTALATAVKQLASVGSILHPVVGDEGWWKRPGRLYEPRILLKDQRPTGRPILLTDSRCRFGKAFVAACERRGLAYSAPAYNRHDPRALRNVMKAVQPWAVIDTGGSPRIGRSSKDPVGCRQQTIAYATSIAQACAEHACKLATFSTDFVFDGRLGRPYSEWDATAPFNAYGIAKARAESIVLQTLPTALVVRSGLVFGKCGIRDFLSATLRTVGEGRRITVADDITTSVAYLPDLAHAVLDVLIDDEYGVFHLAGPESITWADLARQAVRAAGFDASLIESRNAASFGSPATHPAYTPLASERGIVLPPLDCSLGRFLREVDWKSAA